MNLINYNGRLANVRIENHLWKGNFDWNSNLYAGIRVCSLCPRFCRLSTFDYFMAASYQMKKFFGFAINLLLRIEKWKHVEVNLKPRSSSVLLYLTSCWRGCAVAWGGQVLNFVPGPNFCHSSSWIFFHQKRNHFGHGKISDSESFH